jgi:hypothetical protein
MSEKPRRQTALGISDIMSDVTDKWTHEPFQDGFSRRTVIGAFFVAVVMLPGLIYMGLAVGTSIGSGAEWVTVLLFLELARRSYQTLRRQELFMILYMAQSLTGMIGGVMLSGGVFAGLIWNQYLKNSEAFRHFNLTEQMPAWFSPTLDMVMDRSFISEAWIPAIVVAFLGMILFRMQFFGLGYLIFRITSDVEQLPFPLARIGAEGATALAESEEKETNSWRWAAFSTLAVVGIVWGFLYMGIPTLSSALFGARTELIPIPFLDLTPYTEGLFPSSAWAVGFNLALILTAFVLPWRVVVGSAVACILCQAVLPPFLYRFGIHNQWEPGFSALDTQIANGLDLWMSVGLGGAVSVAITGIWMAIRATRSAGQGQKGVRYNWKALRHPPEGRGDYPTWLAVALFVTSAIGYVILVHGIVNLGWMGGFAKPRSEWFPLWILAAFAFLWTPVNSYIHARLAGIAGQAVSIPFVREGSFFLSGYRHPDVWVAPIPLHDLGGVSMLFKQLELTRVKFTSLAKVEVLSLFVLSLAGFLYWSYLWGLGPVPSDNYPYAQEMWPYFAKNMALWASALGEGNNEIISAIKPEVIAGSAALFTGMFALFSWSGIPLAYYFGAVGGVGQFPYIAVTMLIGLGVRVLVARKLGTENLKRQAPVMMAGFSAGFGISGMLIVAVVLIRSAVSAMVY